MKKNAVALRPITHADDSFDKDEVILGMSAGQFNDWKASEMVREATSAEVARAKGRSAPKRDQPVKTPAPADAAAQSPAPSSDAAPADA